MAAEAVTPVKVYQGNLGSFRLVVADFSTGTGYEDGDYWTSYLKGVLGFWVQDTSNPSTQASVGVACVFTATNGVFTFHQAENGNAFTLYVLCRN